MFLEKMLGEKFLKKKNLSYKLNIIFGLFFSFPVLGFIFFSIRYEMLEDKYIPVFFLGVLIILATGLLRYIDLVGDYIGATILFAVFAVILLSAAKFWKSQHSKSGSVS